MKRIRFDAQAHRADIETMIARGLGIMAIAQELEISYEIARLALATLGLSAPDRRGERMRDLGGKLRLAGRTFIYQISKDYIGNWCWNAYWLTQDDAVAFLIWLHSRDLYTMTTGWPEIFDRWEWREPLTAEFLHPLVAQASISEAA